MTPFTSGTSFVLCLIACLCADSWADKPLTALAGAGVALVLVMALTGLARGRKRPISRRNLLPFQRSELALKLKPLVKARAKANQSEAGGDKKALLQKSEKAVAPIHTDEEISKMAGASGTRRSQTQKKTVRRYQHQTVHTEQTINP